MRNISKKCIELIKQFEGCRLDAYRAAKGERYLTIGYGHYGEDVTPGMKITHAQAEAYLMIDIKKFERRVNKYDNIYHWTQNELDALTSFAYNIGNIDQLTCRGTRDKAAIANKINAYVKSCGNVLPGLVRRREAEKKLFLTPDTEGK